MGKLIALLATAVTVDVLAKHLAENAKESAAELIEIHNAANETSKELLDLKKENKTLQALNDSHVAAIEELSNAQPRLIAAPSISFEKEGKNYGFNFHQMTHKSNVITSEIVANDTELQNQLIAMQSGMLKEI